MWHDWFKPMVQVERRVTRPGVGHRVAYHLSFHQPIQPALDAFLLSIQHRRILMILPFTRSVCPSVGGRFAVGLRDPISSNYAFT